MYSSKLKSPLIDQLFNVIMNLDSLEACYRFFEDIGTIKEIQDWAMRFEVARLLSEKKSYQEISERTKASSATISRVNRCLVYGADGYQNALKSLKK